MSGDVVQREVERFIDQARCVRIMQRSALTVGSELRAAVFTGVSCWTMASTRRAAATGVGAAIARREEREREAESGEAAVSSSDPVVSSLWRVACSPCRLLSLALLCSVHAALHVRTWLMSGVEMQRRRRGAMRDCSWGCLQPAHGILARHSSARSEEHTSRGNKLAATSSYYHSHALRYRQPQPTIHVAQCRQNSQRPPFALLSSIQPCSPPHHASRGIAPHDLWSPHPQAAAAL